MLFPELDISVIICAYTMERWNDLVTAVASVQQQSIPPKEIIVVIDHNPELLERAQTQLSGVLVIENGESQGLSGARNSGIAMTKGAIVAFIDEDAIAAPDWLERLQAHYSNPHVMGVGGSIEPLWLSGRPDWFPAEFNWVVGCTYQGMPEEPARVRNLIGCNMSFRREVFAAVGGFRNGIGRVGKHPVGCEETELCIRACQRFPDHIFLYDPQARVQHRVPEWRVQWNYFCSRCYFEGRSKAMISRFVGAKDGLASERTYTLQTLPQGVIHGLIDALFHRNLAGLARSIAIISGFLITVNGYSVESLSKYFTAWKNEINTDDVLTEKLGL